MQDFVGIGGVQDERQTDHLRAEQGKRRHAVTGLPEILHQGELGVGVRAQQCLIQSQIIVGSVQITLRQGGIRLPQIDLGLHGSVGPGIEMEGRGDQVDVILRVGFLPDDLLLARPSCWIRAGRRPG